LASQIKEHTLMHLDHYLEEFEANATKLGTHVHWARDAEEHNAVVYDILQARKVKSLIKSKKASSQTLLTQSWQTGGARPKTLHHQRYASPLQGMMFTWSFGCVGA
jgi:hypothetical protein